MQTLITAKTLKFSKPSCSCGIVSKPIKGFGVMGNAPSSQQRKDFLSSISNKSKSRKKSKGKPKPKSNKKK
jgi:hypothetical protein